MIGELDPSAVSGATENLLIEQVAEGAPLTITFGFYFAEGPGEFEFHGRLKKLEEISGRAINKVLVRDPRMHWYLGGIEGVGTDVPSTVDGLRRVIDGLAPSAVICVGQSMGAYAAILYGALLGADKVIAFGPLSCFDRRKWSFMAERRWMPVLEAIEAAGLDVGDYADLPRALGAIEGPLPDIDLVYGTSPGPGVPANDAVGHDAAHAVRFFGTPSVTLLPIAHSQHAVVEHFRARGVITEVLRQRIFGTSLAGTIDGLRGDPWVAWLLENLANGSTIADLRPVMLAQQTPDQADAYIGRAELLDDLARLEATPPAFTA